MHLPPHPFWFWLILASPILMWAALWAIAQYGRVPLKPLTPWLWAGMVLFLPAYVVLDVMEGHKALRLGAGAIVYTCWMSLLWIEKRYMFETLRGPSAKWYTPRSSATFSIPQNARISVRDIDSVAPWYVQKLGLRKLAGNSPAESGVTTYKFKEDGKSITLTTKTNRTDQTLILFTKKISRMKGVLSARGIDVGPIEQDRQGTCYFEIHDPEGNTIAVVEEQ